MEGKDADVMTTWTAMMKEYFVDHIRFGLMPRSFFVKEVYTAQVLSVEEALKITLHFMDSSIRMPYTSTGRTSVVYSGLVAASELRALKLHKTAECLQYKLSQSSVNVQYRDGRDSYEGLTNNTLSRGVGTQNAESAQFVVATFEGKKHVLRMDIGGLRYAHPWAWDVTHLHGSSIQYQNGCDEEEGWIDWKGIMGLQNDRIHVMEMDIHATAVRVIRPKGGAIGIGCLRFHGFDSSE